MTFSFDPTQGLIVVPTRLWGPMGDTMVQLALDTGASRSTLNRAVAVLLGYDPEGVSSRVQVTTASAVEHLPEVSIEVIEALGLSRRRFSILCHTFPPGATVDGLLGLDFFRDQRVMIDFREGVVTVD